MSQPIIRKTSILGIVIASVCIIVYLTALISVIVRVNSSMERHHLVAEQEFYDLAELASAAGVLSFMDEDFIKVIQGAVTRSRTLEGVIITGPNGRIGFEKEIGRAITFVNKSPEFRKRLIFSPQSLYMPLRIQGLRNVNIEAVAGAIDNAELAEILKMAMFLVGSALMIAFITLAVEALRRRGAEETAAGRAAPAKAAQDDAASPGGTKVHYSPRGHIVREDQTDFRLTEELIRCAAGGHDLAFIVMEYKGAAEESFYARFAADAARFFSSREFVCEKGEKGISVICPGLNLDTAFLNADEFHSRIIGKYPVVFKSKTDLCMGLSARSGRPVNAQRLMFEAEEALERAMLDPVSHTVAFKSDPEKYKAFMESRSKNAD